MKNLAAIFLALIATVATAASITFGNGSIRLTMYEHAGWAVCSLNYNRTEFIDSYDHGRCLQSAVSFDSMGEAFNPTEAGNYPDGLQPNPSTTLLLNKVVDRESAATEVQMAFWQGGRSNHIHRKWINAGVLNRNIIEHKIAFEIPANEAHALGQFEILTGYMPPSFSKFLVWNPATGTTAPLTDGPGEQTLPIIFCNVSETRCMGTYSPQPLAGGGYGRWRFVGNQCMTRYGATGCVKWNMVSRIDNPRGTYRFNVLTTVGTLSEVKTNMALIQKELP